MNWIETLLMIGGVSLDIFATMECQGSLVAKIEKRKLALICCLICIWQLIAFSLGNFLSILLAQKRKLIENELLIGYGIAILICVFLGIHLIVKAIRNEKLQERREEHFRLKHIFHGMAGTGAYTVLTGIAFGIVASNQFACLLLLAILAVLAAIAGTYTGYHFGFMQRRNAYGGGALLLWVAGIIIFARCAVSL